MVNLNSRLTNIFDKCNNATTESGSFTGGIVVDTNGFKKPNQY